jgi:hypothetical protein
MRGREEAVGEEKLGNKGGRVEAWKRGRRNQAEGF